MIEKHEHTGEAAKLKALQQAARKGWQDIAAGRFTDVNDDQLEDFIRQLGLKAANSKQATR